METEEDDAAWWTCPSGEHVYRAADVAAFPTRRGEIQCRACTGTPLERAPLYGAIYLVVAAGLAVAAWITNGIVSVMLALLAGVLTLAGAWTILVTGGVLLLIRRAKRIAGDDWDRSA